MAEKTTPSPSVVPTVYIVGSLTNDAYDKMFLDEGWAVSKTGAGKIDLVCFTGGEDVTPFLYGERPITIDGKTIVTYNPTRDMAEIKLYKKFAETPKVGICRGGQFLNVMNGGSMWQHVDNHTDSHEVYYVSGHKEKTDDKGKKVSIPVWSSFHATSTHHQMMIPTEQATTIGVAGCSQKRYREDKEETISEPAKVRMDPEILYYWHTDSLCFQPHPEITEKNSRCRTVFFDLIKDYLYLSAKKKG